MQRFRIEAQGFADLTRSGLAAIRDDVRGHRRAELAVTLIDILDGLLALLFRRQVEINVRPLTATLGQKPLEEQFHSNRINRRDFEGVADGRVGGASAPLNQDAVLLAVFNDVPDDEEVAGKAELLNQLQFMIDLLLGTFQKPGVALWSVPLRDAFGHALGEKRVHRLAVRHRIARKLIAQIGELKAQPGRQLDSVLDSARNITEQWHHLVGGSQMPLIVERKQATRA